MTNEDKPTISERYGSANSASVLRAEATRSGPLDLIIAAGMSPHRLGTALLRLVSEWDGAAKPMIYSADYFLPGLQAGFRAAYPERGATDAEKKDVKRQAQTLAVAANFTEARLLMGKLRTLPLVRAALHYTAAHEMRFEEPEKVVASTLYWWLDRNCTACQGRKQQTAKGSPALTRAACSGCGGSGLRALPYGDAARQLTAYMSSCTERAAAGMGRKIWQRYG